MGLRIDTSNDTYHWATSDYWYNNPVHITIYNDDATPAKLGGIRLQMIACNAGGHSVNQISSGQAAGQSGTFALYEYNPYTKISQTVTIAAESRSNLCTADSSEPFSNTQTWFIPRYTKNAGAQYNQYSYDGNYISQQDYNNAFYTFKLSSPLIIPANSYAQVTLRLEGGWGTWQLSDLVNATPLPSYQVTYKPNGGNWSGSTSDVVHEVVQGENDTLPTAPTRSGYNFTGWSPSGAPPTNVQQNYTYTAQWVSATVSCTFNRNQYSNDNRVIETKTVNVGTTLASAKPNPNPSWIGIPPMTVAIFEGWSNTPTGTPMTSQQEQACQITVDGTTFYARWRAPRVQFYRNFDANDATLLGDGVASLGLSIGNSTAPRTQADAPDYNEDPNRISSDVLHYNPGEYIDLQGLPLYRDVGPNIEQALLDLETSEYKFIFYGWRTDRTYHIINQDETVACVDLRNCTAQSDDNQNRYYAVWKRIHKARIWVVEQITEGGVTRKEWVKKLNAHKVVENDQHVKSWEIIPPREVVEDAQHHKSWGEKQ